MRSRSATVWVPDGELDHDVVALALVVHLVGEGALAPAVDGAGLPPVAADDLERLVEHALMTVGSVVASKMAMTS